MFKTVNGIRLNYEISGPQNSHVVMLSHSLATTWKMWEPQIHLLESKFQVLRYDTRGHGLSDAPEGAYTLEQLATDVIGLLDELDIQKIHWVGLSMGGMIGQCLGLNHADRIESLSLCDTTAVIPDDAQPIWQERIEIAREHGMTALVESTLERWFTTPYRQTNPPEVQQIREMVLQTPVAGYIGCSEAICNLNYIPRLHKIKIPTLIMVGADDPGTPVAESQAMHAAISDSKLVILPSAAHLSNIEQAEAFNKNLVRFLESQ